MSTVFSYPDGRKAVTARDPGEMPGRARHFYAAFAHAWDYASLKDPFAFLAMRNQALQWKLAYNNVGGE